MNFEKIKEILSKEPKLIEIDKARKIIWVGDTHGDLEASQKVIKDYLKPPNKIIFLGDYVDRGPFSRENLHFLLETKIKNPNQVYLLQGNHETHKILNFQPAEFWQSLNEKEYEIYSSILECLPLAITTKDIIALHGVLPEIENLKEINKIKIGSNQWLQIVWGDFVEGEGGDLGIDPFTGRPQFSKAYFLKLMKKFDKKILIRSHQPTASEFMFDDRCLTIFTSSAYGRERTIAIADLEKELKTAKDLETKRI